MNKLCMLFLMLVLPVLGWSDELEWSISFRDRSAEVHVKLEVEDGEVEKTNLQTREQVRLSLPAKELNRILSVVEGYLYNPRIKVPKEKIRDFIEVKMERAEENKSIELELTFERDSLPADLADVLNQLK